MDTLAALIAPVVTILLVGPFAVAAGLPMTADQGGPLWFVAAPGHDVRDVAARSGGYPASVVPARIGLVVHDQAPGLADRLRANGALLVIDARTLKTLGCLPDD
jgi:hypothetical protein